MPKKKFASNKSLGHSLMNKQGFKPHVSQINKVDGFVVHHTTDVVNSKPQLKSILEQNSLEEFMQLAEMSKKTFTADRYGAQEVIVSSGTVIPASMGAADSLLNQAGMVNKFLSEESVNHPQYRPLKIPRRPEWTKAMSADEINHNENIAFLQWRRDIATIEENNVKLAITPFEKNIEVWKQLWRVIEKSDILLQIVDARNPYFFYSADLEKYIKEVDAGKEFILCINKADYLSEELIKHWNKFFTDQGVKHFFCSALKEQQKLDKEEQAEDSSDYDSEEEEEEEKEFEPMFDELKKKIDIENELKEAGQEIVEEKKSEEILEFNTPTVFTRSQLMLILKQAAVKYERNPDNRLNIGTVGYPNVGKSSLINVLCGKKRVGVAAMPGKTKHFQTLNLEDDGRNICLVDCPGLVFPSIANSKAEMYCVGVLPIQNIRDYMSPCSLILSRISKEVLEAYYRIRLPPRESQKYTTLNFLSIYALKKGWITGGSSNPNVAEAAKVVLKDFTTGAIVFCHARPDFDPSKHEAVRQAGFDVRDAGSTLLIRDAPSEEIKTGEEDQPSDQQSIASSQQSRVVTGEQVVSSGMHANPTALDEDQVDKAFFEKNNIHLKKLKLNKGEKRMLKFMLKKQGEDVEEGGAIDFQKLLNGQDVNQLKQMLGKEMKKQGSLSHKLNFVETGGGSKRRNLRRGTGANSNKVYNFEDGFDEGEDGD